MRALVTSLLCTFYNGGSNSRPQRELFTFHVLVSISTVHENVLLLSVYCFLVPRLQCNLCSSCIYSIYILAHQFTLVCFERDFCLGKQNFPLLLGVVVDLTVFANKDTLDISVFAEKIAEIPQNSLFTILVYFSKLHDCYRCLQQTI